MISGSVLTLIVQEFKEWAIRRHKVYEENRILKRQYYIELIELLYVVFKDPNDRDTRLSVSSKINVVMMVASPKVIKALLDFKNTWGGRGTHNDETMKYKQLLAAMREDLQIKGKSIDKFDISFIDINALND